MHKSQFWSKVRISAIEECWEWQGRLSDKGYGRLILDSIRKRAHRVAYELHYGEINPRLEVCHRCDNPRCCNPHHLFQGTHQDNMTDRRLKGRYPSKLSEEQVRAILQNTHKLNREFAKEFGVDHSTIGKIRRAATRCHDGRAPQPKRNVKLSDDQVREIKSSEAPGVSLARKFGVTSQAISRIRRGKGRKSIACP